MDGKSKYAYCWVGIAYNAFLRTFLDEFPEAADFVEIAYEQYVADPDVLRIPETLKVIAHSSSLSLAGFVSPTEETVLGLKEFLSLSRSPWLGEHLAFITANGLDSAGSAPTPIGAVPYNIEYTVCPQLSTQCLDHVIGTVSHFESTLKTQLLVENPPIYFSLPGSNLGIIEFLQELFKNTSADFLLDLTHLYVSGRNMNFSPEAALEKLPLERVKEIHISGLSKQQGLYWDDHASPAPDVIFNLLEIVLSRVRPMAVTLEYNWSAAFPIPVIVDQLRRIRTLRETN